MSGRQPSDRVVLKIGGSVLRGEAGWADAVRCVLRERASGADVLVVVSATWGTTDELLSAARRRVPEPDDRLLARLLATGEEVSTALLALALADAGTAAEVLSAEELGLSVCGPRTEARPIGLDGSLLGVLLAHHGVLVVPGFVGCHVDGGLALLGRGGSDLTAVFLATRLGASCCLIKDVSGLYVADPNASPIEPGRYCRVSWGTALERGGDLLQPAAIRLAEQHRLSIRVDGIDGRGTIVDEGPCELEGRARSDASRSVA